MNTVLQEKRFLVKLKGNQLQIRQKNSQGILYVSVGFIEADLISKETIEASEYVHTYCEILFYMKLVRLRVITFNEIQNLFKNGTFNP